MKIFVLTKLTREGMLLDNSSMPVNYFQMMKKPYMKSTRNIHPSLLDIVRDWKGLSMRGTRSRKEQCQKLFGVFVFQIMGRWNGQARI
jgi:hypothetical protein